MLDDFEEGYYVDCLEVLGEVFYGGVEVCQFPVWGW